VESDRLGKNLARFQEKQGELESTGVLAEAENKEGEVREISKTHTWKDLSDKF